MNIPMLMQQLMCLEVTERSCHQRFGGWKVLAANWALRGP